MGPIFGGKIADLKTDPKYQAIKAFKESKIYRSPSNLEPWDFPGPSSYLEIIWLSKELYPKRFADVDLLKVVDEFYQSLYGKTFTELGGKL